jgi:ferredoxin
MPRPRFIYNLAMKLWPLLKWVYQTAHRPILGSPTRMWLNSGSTEAVVIPVNEVIQPPKSSLLPFTLLEPLIQQASARFIMHSCMCRSNEGCSRHPHKIGCIFLGEGAAQIDPDLGRLVEPDEALAHLESAMREGLVPLIVHTAFDAYLLGVPFRRTLTVCFCCDCCCTVHHGLNLGPQAFWDVVIRLPGLKVEADDTCVGCETCIDSCFLGAITLQDGRALIGNSCKGCGRCTLVCPTGSITLHLEEEVDVYESLLQRIHQRTDIGANGNKTSREKIGLSR